MLVSESMERYTLTPPSPPNQRTLIPKARASLNYKSLPYKTHWIEYPDIAPTFKSLSITPNDGTAANTDYSSPACKMPDGSYVMDSRNIGVALDELQPEPSLHMDSGYVDRALGAVDKIRLNLGPIGMPRVPDLLNERSAEYFRETRGKRFGMPLAELAKSDRVGENAWKSAEPGLQELRTILNENEGPYVLGKEPSFADFAIAGLFRFVQLLDRGDLYDRLMGYDKAFPEQFKACGKWFEREDH